MNIRNLFIISCSFLFLCSPNKTDSKIQTISAISACLEILPKSNLKIGYSSPHDTTNVPLDKTGYICFQGTDSLNFSFYASIPCEVTNLRCSSALISGDTAKVIITYDNPQALCDCKHSFNIIITSHVVNLSKLKCYNANINYLYNFTDSLIMNVL